MIQEAIVFWDDPVIIWTASVILVKKIHYGNVLFSRVVKIYAFRHVLVMDMHRKFIQ